MRPIYFTERKLDTHRSNKKKKEKFFIDFDCPVPDWDACFATSRASTVLAKATLARKPEDLLLPIDIQYKPESLMKLFVKPSMRVFI